MPEVHTLMRQYIAWKSFVRTVDALAQRRPELGVAVSVQTMANPSLLVAVVSIADKYGLFLSLSFSHSRVQGGVL